MLYLVLLGVVPGLAEIYHYWRGTPPSLSAEFEPEVPTKRLNCSQVHPCGTNFGVVVLFDGTSSGFSFCAAFQDVKAPEFAGSPRGLSIGWGRGGGGLTLDGGTGAPLGTTSSIRRRCLLCFPCWFKGNLSLWQILHICLRICFIFSWGLNQWKKYVLTFFAWAAFANGGNRQLRMTDSKSNAA